MAVSPGSSLRAQTLHLRAHSSTSWYLFPSAVDKSAMSEDCLIFNPLILPSTSRTGDVGDDQLQSRGPRRSTCLDLPRNLVLGSLSRLNLLGDLPVQGSQEVDMPRPAQGPNSQKANLPRPAQGFDLQEAVTPRPAWGSAS